MVIYWQEVFKKKKNKAKSTTVISFLALIFMSFSLHLSEEILTIDMLANVILVATFQSHDPIILSLWFHKTDGKILFNFQL